LKYNSLGGEDNNMLSFNEYMTIVEQAPIMIWRANTTTQCDYFNKQWLDFTGRRLEQELGNGWAEGVFKDDFERCLDIYLTAFQKREIFEMEYRLRRYDGEYRWIFDRGVPFQNEQGVFSGYIGSCIDITDRVEARKMILEKQKIEITHLRDLLPICSHCKKIRDDKGYWQRVESYISQYTDAEFSHGICPDCVKKYYGDLDMTSE
jgi:PAS domain S-box-containing protein